jgi:hypothetical protein
VKLDQFHLLYPKLLLDSIKFEKMSEGSVGFGENKENGQFLTESSDISSNFIESNSSFG